ncbi:hypothetical protein SKAU_G00068360 [Synaphobranchus kaupii]|uniref:Uncharacterized protein n=1 Tax=Synaphobranchus kaupii TaxID=118154 RepID=A0A9Q1G6P9_SYNKA|nr:hypothetical protein SKAU_G00068360 [Synaphobranchus kaupii]
MSLLPSQTDLAAMLFAPLSVAILACKDTWEMKGTSSCRKRRRGTLRRSPSAPRHPPAMSPLGWRNHFPPTEPRGDRRYYCCFGSVTASGERGIQNAGGWPTARSRRAVHGRVALKRQGANPQCHERERKGTRRLDEITNNPPRLFRPGGNRGGMSLIFTTGSVPSQAPALFSQRRRLTPGVSGSLIAPRSP